MILLILSGQQRVAAGEADPPALAGVRISSQPSSVTEDTNFTVTAQLIDQYGDDWAEAGVSLSIAKQSGTGTLSNGGSGTTDSNGAKTWTTLQLDTGSASVVLRVTLGSPAATVDTTTITVTASGASPDFTEIFNYANTAAMNAAYDAGTGGTVTPALVSVTGHDGSTRNAVRYATPGDGSGSNISSRQIHTLPSTQVELWIEYWQRIVSPFPGTYSGFQECKNLLAYRNSGSRSNIELFNSTDNYVHGYPGDGDTEASDVGTMPASIRRVTGDGLWHRYRVHWKLGSGPIFRFYLDDDLISDLSVDGTETPLPSSISGAYSELSWGFNPLNNSPSNVVYIEMDERNYWYTGNDPGWGF